MAHEHTDDKSDIEPLLDLMLNQVFYIIRQSELTSIPIGDWRQTAFYQS